MSRYQERNVQRAFLPLRLNVRSFLLREYMLRFGLKGPLPKVAAMDVQESLRKKSVYEGGPKLRA